MAKKLSALPAVSAAAGANEIEVNEAGTSKKATLTQVGALLISDTAYDATTWNGVTTVAPSKNAVRDLYEALLAGVSASFDTLAEIATALAAKAASGANTDITSLAGTATNDSAAAGKVGEFLSAVVAVGSPAALTTNTALDVTSLSLTAGDWDVSASVGFVIANTAVMTDARGCISSTSATLPTPPGTGAAFQMAHAFTTNTNQVYPTGTQRFSLAVTTTVYLVAQATFTTAAVSAFGFLRARRMR